MNGIWGAILKLFGLDGFTSPRQDLLGSIVGSLWAPPAASITSQGYLRMVSYFLWFALFLVACQLCYALAGGLTQGNLGQKLKSWLISSFLVFGGVYLLPGFFTASRSAFNAIGREIVGQFLGTDDRDKVIQIIGTLTGHASLDFVLSLVQIGFLLVLAIEVKMVFVAMFISVVLILIGVTMRWLGEFGDNVFKFCLNVTVFGIAGNAVVLLVIGAIVGIGRATTSDPITLGLLNTAAIIIACVIFYFFMKRMGGRMKALVSGTVKGVHGAGNHLRSGSRFKSGGGAEQTEQESASHRGHASKVAQATAKSDPKTPGGSKTSKTQASAETVTETKPAWRRYSSTAARSLMNHGSSKTSSETGAGSTETVSANSSPSSGGSSSTTAAKSRADKPRNPSRVGAGPQNGVKLAGTSKASGKSDRSSSQSSGGSSPAQMASSKTGTSSRHSHIQTATKVAAQVVAKDNPAGASAVIAYKAGSKAKTRHDMKRRNAAERRQS